MSNCHIAQTADSHQRTIAKTLTWRVLSLGITATVAWFLTREVYFAACLGAVDTCVKLGGYYFHERIWELNRFGRTPLSVAGRTSDLVTGKAKENRKWRRLSSLKRT
jgi:uncharacterized membrane protein